MSSEVRPVWGTETGGKGFNEGGVFLEIISHGIPVNG